MITMKIFSGASDSTWSMEQEIQDYLQRYQKQGYTFYDKTVDMTRCGDNSLIKPRLVITIWLKQEVFLSPKGEVSVV